MEIMYRNLQMAEAIDVKKSILWMDNTFYTTTYEPTYIGNTVYFTFDQEWQAVNSQVSYEVTNADCSYFKDIEKHNEFEFSKGLHYLSFCCT